MPGEAPTDVPPAAFGRFRVLHQIGVGSLGPVFRGEDPQSRTAVAIKQFQLNLSPEVARRVADELRTLQDRPSHAATPVVVEAGVYRNDPYLVTMWAPGESLDVALREYGPAAIADALPRLQHLAQALDRAAAAGVWHGALQPRDILIDGPDTHLVGLGVTPILERAGVHRSTRRPYAAPELMNGDPTSPRTDQYALGAIAYEWFFGGRAPRSAESVLDAPSLPGVNAEALAGALMSALATNAADRFATCTAFVEAVDDALVRSVLADDEKKEVVAGAGLLPLEAFVAEDASDEGDDIPLKEPPRPAATRSITFDPPLAPPRNAPEPVAWQGNLGAISPRVTPNRVGFSSGMMVVALVAGAAIGGAAGYMFATMRPTSTTVPVETSARTASDARAKEFTDAPLASPPAPAPVPAPSTTASPSPDAARAAVSSEPPRAPAPAAPENAAPSRDTASLLVRSSPAGAVVSVDGTARGTTPLTLRDLELGTRTVTLSRPGYLPSERRVALTADRPSRSLDVELSPIGATPRTTREPRSTQATTASLVVDSRPAGSSVVINGQVAGTTPLTVESVSPGTLTIRIERPGYRPYTETVELKAGERRRVAASLELGQE